MLCGGEPTPLFFASRLAAHAVSHSEVLKLKKTGTWAAGQHGFARERAKAYMHLGRAKAERGRRG